MLKIPVKLKVTIVPLYTIVYLMCNFTLKSFCTYMCYSNIYYILSFYGYFLVWYIFVTKTKKYIKPKIICKIKDTYYFTIQYSIFNVWFYFKTFLFPLQYIIVYWYTLKIQVIYLGLTYFWGEQTLCKKPSHHLKN